MKKLFYILLTINAAAVILLVISYWPERRNCLTCNAYPASGTLTDCLRFDAPAWRQAGTYPLQAADISTPLREDGNVKFVRHGDHLLCLAKLSDSNIVQRNDSDNALLCESGDVLEIFLRAENQLCYWEMHFAPDGRIGTLFYPASGGEYEHMNVEGIKTKIKLDGTLNQASDRDRGWRLLAVIPLAELYRRGAAATGIPLPSEKSPPNGCLWSDVTTIWTRS